MSRSDSTRPFAVATSTCPRTIVRPYAVLKVPSISSGCRDIGSTRPTIRSNFPTWATPATGSPSLSQSAMSKRLPSGCPSSGPSVVNLYCKSSAQPRPQSSSLQSAANAMRRSPGGINENSSRSLPLDPPLSATVTIAVSSLVKPRIALRVTAKPCPPPKETT